jgi:aryl carrier-like protein
MGTLDAILAESQDRGPRPLALYVHIPFCASKCHFCDWVVDIPVRQLRQQANERRPYIEALKQQIRHYGPLLMAAGYRPRLLYWGHERMRRLAGVSFDSLRETPQIRAWLGYLQDRGAELIETETDLQLAEHNRHRVYIAQLFGIVF